MTPKEKAIDIYNKIFEHQSGDTAMDEKVSKSIAVLLCDEIMFNKHECGCEQSIVIDGKIQTYITYWQQVKKEIEKL